MTNQTELEAILPFVWGEDGVAKINARNIMRYIAANYTPNSEVMRLRIENAAKLANLDQKIVWLEGKIEGLTKDKETNDQL